MTINLVYQSIQRCAFFSNHPFFFKVLKLVLEIMLSQKLAALFTLTVFASQGVIGRPSPQVGGLAGAVAAAAVKAAVQAVGDGGKAAVGAVNAVQAAAGAVGGVRDAVGDVVS